MNWWRDLRDALAFLRDVRDLERRHRRGLDPVRRRDELDELTARQRRLKERFDRRLRESEAKGEPDVQDR